MRLVFLFLAALAAQSIAQSTTTKKSSTKTTKTTKGSTTKSTKLSTTLATSIVTTRSIITTTITSPPKTTTSSAGGSVGTGIYAEACPFGFCTLNGGTTGGAGGPVTVVSTLDALISAVTGDNPKIVIISGTITGNVAVLVGSNTSILGRNGSLIGVGLRVLDAHNVIIRNLKIGKCQAPIDSIGVQGLTTKNIWLDHLELYADQDHDKVGFKG